MWKLSIRGTYPTWYPISPSKSDESLTKIWCFSTSGRSIRMILVWKIFLASISIQENRFQWLNMKFTQSYRLKTPKNPDFKPFSSKIDLLVQTESKIDIQWFWSQNNSHRMGIPKCYRSWSGDEWNCDIRGWTYLYFDLKKRDFAFFTFYNLKPWLSSKNSTGSLLFRERE